MDRASAAAPQTQFDFGANWASYARTISEDKIDEAVKCLRQLLGQERIDGLRFLDIGCGSGLHALAALRMGAASVTAVDINPRSTGTTEAVLRHHAPGQNWTVEQRNILTEPPEGTYDIVYSWGVLHHTGDMDRAVRNAAALVVPGGRLVIALYKKTPLCGAWKLEKRIFTGMPGWLRPVPTAAYSGLYMLGLLVRGRNPVKYVRTYRTARGMNFWHDAIDWLGGYPYESASPAEVADFVTGLGFTSGPSFNTGACAVGGLFGSGCAEYVFHRPGT
jgi:2-polyprenyl-6-hydroxyphenyl methylase/3-demethylubiquinone-9 3-methyltransferase